MLKGWRVARILTEPGGLRSRVVSARVKGGREPRWVFVGPPGGQGGTMWGGVSEKGERGGEKTLLSFYLKGGEG